MSTNYPTSVDDNTILPNPTGGNNQNSPDHAAQHANANDAIKALEAKVGTGATTPVANRFLFGTNTGVSVWTQLTSAQVAAAVSDETGTGSLVFGTTPTLITPKVDTINENTTNNGVTIDGLNIKDGALNTSSSVPTIALQSASVTNAKLATTSGELGGPWQSWTPSIAGVTVGNGTLTGKYIQFGKTVFFKFSFTLGSTSSVSGALLTLPVAAVTGFIGMPIGNNSSYDTSAGSTFGGQIILESATTATFRVIVVSAGTFGRSDGVTTTNPMSWATGDIMSAQAVYEVA